jgi:hypothetical protein
MRDNMSKVIEKAMSMRVKFSDGRNISVKERVDEFIERGYVVYEKDENRWSWCVNESGDRFVLRNSVWINYFKFAIKNK